MKPSTSYDTDRRVEDLLEHLREKGISPTNRAKLLRDHMIMCFVEVEGLNDPYGVAQTPLRQFKRLFSRRVQDLHWNSINSDKDFKEVSKYSSGISEIFRNCIKDVFGDKVKDMNAGINIAMAYQQEDTTGTISLNEWIDIISGSSRSVWEAIDEMQMDEDDLADMLDRKRPFHRYENGWKQPSESLEKGYNTLAAAGREAGIPYMTTDVISGLDSKEVFSLSRSLRKANKAYQDLGCSSMCLNRMPVQVSPWQDGTSGVMMANTDKRVAPTTDKNPIIGLSSRGGWEYSEVIIHEALHAHDALMYEAEGLEKGRGLLSDELEDNLKYNTPLAQAWRELAEGISSIEDNVDQSHMEMAQQAMADRWVVMGLDRQGLERSFGNWKASTDENRNDVLTADLKKLFDSTPFEESASFRSQVIAAEIQIMDNALKNLETHTISKTPVFEKFTSEFDQYLDKPISGAYRKGYFEEMAERVARAMQNVLDVGQDQPENPYSKRWLVYAGTHLSENIKHKFEAFFSNPAVKEAYKKLEEMPGDLLRDESRTRINAEMKTWNTSVRQTAVYKPS